ncbi:hypothetical protein [Methylobacterium sp. Leaf108]|uniref:hypothetical protein n=1 Tax=Methylobacterium sp. Leaf108 TaxID=1736256 RepID=UPI0006FB816A|nr:hypothetical protein [Methylobacterium sp. Leaf108]KQP61495.1 hypothetical protein ASF39_02110 [Methylobacterium sp. Leaf108]
MIETALLDRAVARGIITQAQAHDLAGLSRETVDEPVPSAEAARDDEQLRLVTGFADIFVTIGLVLFLGTAAYIGTEVAGALVGHVLVAAMAWGLAEFFTRRRRMALPSIVLLLAFAGASFSALAFAFGDGSGLGGWVPALDLFGSGAASPGGLAIAGLGTLALCALHYRRFAVPVTIAAGTAALAATLLGLAFAAAPEAAARHSDALFVVTGLAVFALAMRYDLADPHRSGRKTDIAFWLHLLAAPLIVHPVLSNLVTVTQGATSSTAALTVLAIVLVLALVALITDRRAILVAAMVYTAVAFGTLIRDAGLASRSLPLSLMALGAFVLLLSAGWHPLRGLVLRLLPRGLSARLPHPLAHPPGTR